MIDIDLQSFSFLIGTILVIIVNLENAFEIYYWTKAYHAAFWGTILFYFLLHYFLYSTLFNSLFHWNYSFVGVASHLTFQWNFGIFSFYVRLFVFYQDFFESWFFSLLRRIESESCFFFSPLDFIEFVFNRMKLTKFELIENIVSKKRQNSSIIFVQSVVNDDDYLARVTHLHNKKVGDN